MGGGGGVIEKRFLYLVANSNSKTLFYKDSSLGLVKSLRTSPC